MKCIKKLMVWVNIIKPLEIASFNSIYPKMLTPVSIRGIRLTNQSYFSVIGKTTMASCLEVSKKVCLFMLFTLDTFPIVILIIIPPVSEFVISLNIILHTTYLALQKVGQKIIARCILSTKYWNVSVSLIFLQSWQECLLHFHSSTSLSSTG